MSSLTATAPTPPGARRGIFNTPIIEHRKLCREHYILRVRATAFPPTLPGQFVQIGLSTGHSLDLAGPTLRRPFSIAGRQDTHEGTTLDFIYRVVGQLTSALEKLSPGQSINLLGPLGQPFPMPEPNQPALLVGGGVGIPPMIYLASHICALRGSGKRTVAFAGATTRDLLSLTITNNAPAPTATSPSSLTDPLYNIAEFDASGVPAVISTDDGSYGFPGYITAALDAYLDRYFADSWDIGSLRPVVYTCGPEVMMKKIADIAARRGLTCYAAVERAMACGLGTCQSCVIRVQAPNLPDGWRYALSCTEGPVFNTRELLW